MGLLFVGAGAGLYLPSGMAAITAAVAPKDWGKAISIHELAPNLSFVAAPLISEAVMVWFSWRAVFGLLGIAAMLLSLVFARLGRGGDFYGQAPSVSSFGGILKQPVFWIMVVMFSLGISGSLGIYTMLPLYLVTTHGLERDWANAIVALSRVATIAITLVVGWATDRLGAKRILIIVFATTGALTIFLGLAPTSWVVETVFLQSIAAACFFPAGLAALSAIGSDTERSIVVSLTIPLAFMMGAGAIPMVIGFAGDTGSFGLGIALVGALIAAGAAISGHMKS
jgi:NNP family nitrate/nitrite transporter-like MFS transporter